VHAGGMRKAGIIWARCGEDALRRPQARRHEEPAATTLWLLRNIGERRVAEGWYGIKNALCKARRAWHGELPRSRDHDLTVATGAGVCRCFFSSQQQQCCRHEVCGWRPHTVRCVHIHPRLHAGSDKCVYPTCMIHTEKPDPPSDQSKTLVPLPHPPPSGRGMMPRWVYRSRNLKKVFGSLRSNRHIFPPISVPSCSFCCSWRSKHGNRR